MTPRRRAGLQVLISRLGGHRRRDGRGAAAGGVQPEHQGAGRLLGGRVHAAGELLAQAEHIPVHLGSMPASVRAAIDAYGGWLEPGDHVVVNDPFAGGTHLNDITVVTPVFATGGSSAGWPTGPTTPTSAAPRPGRSRPTPPRSSRRASASRRPATRGELRGLLLAASRTPEERAGDLDAQVGANVVGSSGSLALGEAAVRRGGRLRRAPDAGRARGAARRALAVRGRARLDRLAPDQQRPARIVVTVTIAGDEITFDFTGTDPQARGNVNAVEAVTVSAVASPCAPRSTRPSPPTAARCGPVHVIAPAGRSWRARPRRRSAPATSRSASASPTSASARSPRRLPGSGGAAGQGTMNNVLIGGEGWVYYETIAGGQGGQPHRAGMSGVHTAMTNSRNTPIEALERAFPLRVLRYRLARGAAAPAVPGRRGHRARPGGARGLHRLA